MTDKTETQDVVVLGPNLPDQSKGQFHVHADGCRHARHSGGYFWRLQRQGQVDGFQMTATSRDDVVWDVYDNGILQEAGIDSPDHPDFDRYREDFHFAPCVTLH